MKMTKKNLLFSLKTETIIASIFIILFPFLITSLLHVRQQIKLSNEQFRHIVGLTEDKTAAELDSCFLAIEKSVVLASRVIFNTIDEKQIQKNPEYEKKYMDFLSDELTYLAENTKGCVAVYFRMNLEKYGGTSGVFIEYGDNKKFINIKPTDLLQYSPTDTEHVGWYYIPLWKKAPVWTAPYENKNINMYMVSYIIPMFKEGEFLGLVGMDINLATLKNIVNKVPSENMLAMLIGEDGDLVYYNQSFTLQKSVKQSAEISEMFDVFSNLKKNTLGKFNWNDKSYFGSNRKLENGMTLITSISDKEYSKTKSNQLMIFALSFLITLLFAIILLQYLMRKIIIPIKTINKTGRRLARGELGLEIPYKSNNELGELADNIQMMTSQMKEYIDYISSQAEADRKAKELALSESKNKSEFLASIYLSLHEIDLNQDTFTEIQVHSDVAKSIGTSFDHARATVRRVMEERVRDKGKEREGFMEFINFDTLEERMKGRKSIAHEFQGTIGYWCRARFILVDRNPDGTLHHVLWAIENINEEKAVRDKLQNEADRQAAASQAKSSFLANMSHEIRTPINAVLGMDEMILREAKDKTILGYAANIKNAGTSLLSIINDILDFSKIEAGKMELLPENYDISSLVVDLVNMIRERAENKGLNLILKSDPKMPKTLFGDSIRIKQCILNLLTNAVKYTKEGTITFTVGYKKLNDSNISLFVSVKDTGSGIKAEDMQKLFSPFERIEEGKNKTIEGTGLGMSIVMRMLAMMNTKLDVESEYGVGSTFSFEVEQPVIDWTEVGDITEAYKASLMQIAGYKEKLCAPKARLLFVDDTEMNLEVIKGLLKKTKMYIDTAMSGKEALEKVKGNCYDILFIDHRMPEMDGIETLHFMQKMEGNLSAGKPCIALTANAITGVKKMYLEEGFTDYLSKPVNPDKLEDMIRKYLPEDYLEEISDDEAEEENAGSDAENEFLKKLSSVEGINLDAALQNCGSARLLESTVKKYHDTIDEKADELQRFYEDEDWENYCTKVHALKSTSRLIGAMEVSEKAAELEELSNKKESDKIKEKHTPLMTLFKGFKEKLSALIKKEDDEAGKPEISAAELKEKLSKIGKAAEDFDIDLLDSLMAELSAYAHPQSFKDTFAKIRTCVENVDFIELKKILSE